MRTPIAVINDRLQKFNFRLVARLLGMLLVIMALSMIVPIAVSIFYGDGSQFGLVLSALIIMMLGLFLRNFLGVGATYELHEKESFWFTAIIWVVVPLMGALPYIFTSSVTSFTDAAFESFSGFTTTGSSIMTNLERVPQGLLVWRSTSQWIGGLGLILFVVALLHRLNEGSARLYEAEFSGTLQRRLHPRMARNVVLMWTIYVGLTLALFLLLMSDGNGFVDSFCTALSTVSTGGFMTHNAGLVGFSDFSMICITLFMFLSGINLALLFCFFTFRWRQMRGDEEFLRYLLIFSSAVLLCFVAFSIADGFSAFNIQFSLFHVASTLSTCGFYTTPPPVWPMTVSVVTFLLIFIGASSGSTGGGLKIKRLMILARFVRNYFVQMIHPRAVLSVKVNGKVVEKAYVTKILSYIFLYLMFVVLGAFVLTLCGSNIPNAFCMAAANISNLGPSPVINNLGASLDYVHLMPVAKWTLMLLMLAGRIEIFAIVAVLMPAYWRRRN
ncbi:MAG: TrkH family potassium uptake protein [Bacteroidales bacterium]|nr:TrkH family potassium uptake protein [Bacteroidales bacterium]